MVCQTALHTLRVVHSSLQDIVAAYPAALRGAAEQLEPSRKSRMCNLYSITTNQAAIIALFRVINRYVGNLPPMPGV
jgi:hypothetical protein